MTATVFTPTIDGVIAALLAPFFMSLGFFIWDIRWTASHGSAFALNMYKCNVASVWFAIMAGIRGFSTEDNVEVFTVTSVGYLTLSSTLGIIIGDVLWLEALRLLGAKHVIVADSLKPFAAAILGLLFLGESLHPLGYGGMVLTVLGVGVVAWEGQTVVAEDDEVNIDEQSTSAAGILEGTGDKREISKTQEITEEGLSNENKHSVQITQKSHVSLKDYKRGYACAILNILADSFGSFLTKQHGVGMSTWSINLIRFGFAGIILLFISAGMRLQRRCLVRNSPPTKAEDIEIPATVHVDDLGVTVNDKATTTETSINVGVPKWFELPSLTRQGWLQITLGVAFVTFLCPALEKFALMQIALGLCLALASVGPLYGLVMDWIFKGRKPTALCFVGAVLAIGGVAILCIYGI